MSPQRRIAFAFQTKTATDQGGAWRIKPVLPNLNLKTAHVYLEQKFVFQRSIRRFPIESPRIAGIGRALSEPQFLPHRLAELSPQLATGSCSAHNARRRVWPLCASHKSRDAFLGCGCRLHAREFPNQRPTCRRAGATIRKRAAAKTVSRAGFPSPPGSPESSCSLC